MNLERVFLPVLALLLGVATSVYFLTLWLGHPERKFSKGPLYLAVGLFLMYWFQIPAIMIGFGKPITVTDFNLFFALTFPITFVALALFYSGILKVAHIDLTLKKRLLLFFWFLAAISFFAYQFIITKGVISTYILPLGGNIFFYIPMRIMIAGAALKLLKKPEMKTWSGIAGIILVLAEAGLGISRNIFVIKSTLQYPPQFWYMVMSTSKFFFITQTLSVILLALGFLLLHKAFHRRFSES